MSRLFRVWNDSGANIHSKFEVVTSLDELGLTEAEWDGMTEDEREETMREVAFQRSDWGYAEIKGSVDEDA